MIFTYQFLFEIAMYFPPPPRRDTSAALPQDKPPEPPELTTPPLEPPPPQAPPCSGDKPPTEAQKHQGSFKLFRLAGTDVYVHWSWFLVAVFMIQDRYVLYSSMIWDAIQYVLGFAIVLFHEFGHVLACKRGGGTARSIFIWPLGGLAFVVPKPRPGPYLWTSAAGPLVNVLLAPLLIGAAYLLRPPEWEPNTDIFLLARSMAVFNAVVLAFNLLPVYPLDGGRILHAVLWWALGPGRGLAIAAGIGLLASAALGTYALYLRDWWFVAMAAFMGLGAIGGIRHAQKLLPLDRAPRRKGYACPSCGCQPRLGEFWMCPACQIRIDLFESRLACPKCSQSFQATPCIDCGALTASADWVKRQEM